ncbi:MAG: 3-hydroxyacyl-CoA dehydrogenase NAD-binding domain-containing protein [Gammaproteobacteria bacterium]
MSIEKVAVIGAGVMGASIAAHVANAGIPVLLLDIVPKDADNRNAIAESAVAKLLKAQPEPFMLEKNAGLITPGNIEDNLDDLSGVDWVIEAVVENPKIKKSLYQKLDEICPANTLISSNTSTLPLGLLMHGLSEEFHRRFIITHFFNPPRYMRLLELVTAPQSRPELVDAVREFADRKLGKGCVICKDTPGFIANRIGMFWLQCGMLEAIDRELTVEEADAVMGPVLGFPKTGIFGLLDLVGLDLMPHITEAMKMALPPEDDFTPINRVPERVQAMIAEGYTGRKGKGGFYRLNTESGRRIKESVDLKTGEYRPSHKPVLDSVKAVKQDGVRGLLTFDDKTGRYAWNVLSRTLVYAAGLIPQIADDIASVDTAMKLGYNWRFGPFELLDQIGVDWFVDRLNEEERQIPPLLKNYLPLYKTESGNPYYLNLTGGYRPLKRADGVLLLADVKLRGPAVLENPSASLWDIGDGVACLEFHTKMNTFDMDSLSLIRQSLDKVKSEFGALVIYNEGDNFSAGANLGLLVTAIHNRSWKDVENMISLGQQTYRAIKYAPFPAVGAPSGLALGGGCEILLHCDAVQAHAELYVGLVETGVGLVPGWGGCKEFLRRCIEHPGHFGGPMPPIFKAFQTIGTASVSKSAFHAKTMRFLSKTDGVTMNRDRLLADAKEKALALAKDYAPPEPFEFRLPGKTAKAALVMALMGMRLVGKATAYDTEVGKQLARVLSGGDCDITEPVSEDDLLALELESFVHLTKQPGTLERLEHTLKTGKPLRN